MERLAALPRFTPTTTDLLGHRIALVDAASFLWTYRELYTDRIYEFASPSPAPRIIDGGANIGLSVLFFKSLFPDARVTCFEPDPAVLDVLAGNMRAARLTDARIEPYALWSTATTLAFASDGADGGRIAGTRDGPSAQVKTVRLRDYLDSPVDFLKLDIEGAETEVLLDSEDRLDTVRRLYVEYHSFADRPQSLHVLLGVLQRTGFRVQLARVSALRQPFLSHPLNNGFDLQLHVFAYRE